MSNKLVEQNTQTIETRIKDSRINNLSPNWGIMLTMQENLNFRIGVRRRKKYISAAFWNYISTPINFIITLFTAISASQTATPNNFLSNKQVFYILLTTFILSIVNTFFKLKEKAQLNYDAAKKYDEFGSEFENIYFTPMLKPQDVGQKLQKYNELHNKIMQYSYKENIDEVNYITEVIYYFTKQYNPRFRQIEMNERYWVLDGRPNYNYNNDHKIRMEEYFRHDFDIAKKHERGKRISNLFGLLGNQDEIVEPVIVKQYSNDDDDSSNEDLYPSNIEIDFSETSENNIIAIQS